MIDSILILLYHFVLNIFRCIAPDNRGYGDSDKPDGMEHYNISKLGDDVKDLVKGR